MQIWFNKVSDVEAEEWKEQEREGNFDRVLLTTVSQRAGYNGRKTALNTIFNNKTGTNRLVNPELLTNREMHLIARRLHLTKDELIDIFFCELFDKNGEYIEQE